MIKDDKFFNSFELQAKYEYKFKNLILIVFNLGSFSSAQSMFSPFVVLSEDAYIRQYVHEFENYLCIKLKNYSY